MKKASQALTCEASDSLVALQGSATKTSFRVKKVL